MTEGLGLRTQIGVVKKEYAGSIEAPVILLLEGSPVVLFSVRPNRVVIGHPREGLLRKNLAEFQESLNDEVRFALPRRIGSTPTSRFGWGWFTPLLGKYKRSLILVFVTSLLAQLAGRNTLLINKLLTRYFLRAI